MREYKVKAVFGTGCTGVYVDNRLFRVYPEFGALHGVLTIQALLWKEPGTVTFQMFVGKKFVVVDEVKRLLTVGYASGDPWPERVTTFPMDFPEDEVIFLPCGVTGTWAEQFD